MNVGADIAGRAELDTDRIPNIMGTIPFNA
jgi:hypothetical protein